MFKLNQVQRTKKGEKLMPFDVQGDIVYCFTESQQTVMRNLDDFDFTKKKPQKQIFVAPVRQDDELFSAEEEQEANDNELVETKVFTPQPQESEELQPEPEAEPEPEQEDNTNDQNTSGSIWSDLGNGDYI